MRKSKLAETKGRDLKLKNRERSEKVRSEIRIDENLSIFEERKGGDKIVLMYSSVILRQSYRKSNYQHGGEEEDKAWWHERDVTRRPGTGGPLILVLLPNFVPPPLIVLDVPETRHEG